jgi:5-methylcytosine-specific restriction endonuclease McrA
MFETLPSYMRERIEILAARSKVPPRWLMLGDKLAQIESRAWYEWHLRRLPTIRARRRERKRVRRHRIADRDGWRCGICRDQISSTALHIDHIVPVCRGGGSNPENLQATHSWCNLLKGDK